MCCVPLSSYSVLCHREGEGDASEYVHNNSMLNLANKITLLRMLAAPLVIVLLYFENRTFCILAAILFTLASLTDWVDGYVARRENMVTSLGKFLDPLADKVLVCSVLIMFVELNWAPAWVAIIIICRELVVTGLRAIAADEGIVIAADKFGKMKTAFQMFAIVPLLVHYPVAGFDPQLPGEVLLYIATALAVYSGYKYCAGFFRGCVRAA